MHVLFHTDAYPVALWHRLSSQQMNASAGNHLQDGSIWNTIHSPEAGQHVRARGKYDTDDVGPDQLESKALRVHEHG